MATTFTKNQTVRLKLVVPQGPIDALRMDEDGVVFTAFLGLTPMATRSLGGLLRTN
jgi:hypothetical protein